MHSRDRTVLDHLYQRGTMLLVQPRRLSRRLAVDQTHRAFRVEPQHPVANDLHRHPACLGRTCPARAIVDHRKCQQPTDLTRVFALTRKLAQHRPIIVPSQWDRLTHGEPPLSATLEPDHHRVGESLQ